MLERINLIPQKTGVDKFWPAAYGVLLVFVLIALAVIFIKKNIVTRNINEINSAMKTAVHKQENIEMLQNKVRKFQMDIDRHKAAVAVLDEQLAKHSHVGIKKYPYARLIQNFASSLPKSAKVDHISIDKQSGTISGSATNYEVLPRFAATLGDSGLFESVSLQAIEGRGNPENLAAFVFNIEFQIAANAKATRQP